MHTGSEEHALAEQVTALTGKVEALARAATMGQLSKGVGPTGDRAA
jgi:hypothetical protein